MKYVFVCLDRAGDSYRDRERDKERDRERETERERQKERDSETERQRERKTEIYTDDMDPQKCATGLHTSRTTKKSSFIVQTSRFA